MAMVEHVRPRLPALERAMFFDTPEWEELASGAGFTGDLHAPRARARLRRPDQHPVHERHHRLPQGRDAHPPQHPQQRVLRRRDCSATPSATGCASRCRCTTASAWCSATSPRPRTAPAWCIPPRRSSPGRRSRRAPQERCTSLYGVPTMFIAELAHERFAEFDLGSLRTGIMAGSPCPIEVMKRVSAEMGIDEMSIAFGMTETSPVTTQVAPRRHAREPLRHRRPGHAPRRDQDHRSGDRPDGPARRARRVLRPRLRRDAAATGTTPSAPPRRSTRSAGCTPATWRRWTRTATSASSAGSRTWSSAAARTSTRARSRSSSTPTRRSPTCR